MRDIYSLLTESSGFLTGKQLSSKQWLASSLILFCDSAIFVLWLPK